MASTGPRRSTELWSRAEFVEEISGTYNTGVWDGESDICHDSDHGVLLEIELPWVETPRAAEGGERSGREDCFQEFTSKESKYLSHISRNRDTRLTNMEELVDKPSVNC